MPLILRVTSHQKSFLNEDRTHVFNERGGSIGRSPDNDWVLPDPSRYVSSRHANVSFHAGEYFLIDTSTNGVYLNHANEPLGRGRQHHLSDGDRLRLGDYEITASLTGADMTVPHGDGREPGDVTFDPALLAEIDDSVDLEVLLEDEPEVPSVPSRTASVTREREAPVATSQPSRAARLWLESAGLDPAGFSAAQSEELLQLGGQMARATAAGLIELLHSHAAVRERSGVPALSDPVSTNHVDVDDMLSKLIAHEDPAGRIQELFDAVRAHEAALLTALQATFDDLCDRLHPAELQERFDRQLGRGVLFGAANRLKYWNLYRQAHEAMTQKTDSGFPQAFEDELARAYEAELERRR
ncbi:hypothetical protein BH24PSE2_BH24PSE2_03980 [soil metagenome]